ncbi:protein FAM167B-like [Mytilus trossulus]|uniref:protein FAM167B-like n=1 Tax=Mytilus trossulus TaxID=6551 RepID=UPI0030041A7B
MSDPKPNLRLEPIKEDDIVDFTASPNSQQKSSLLETVSPKLNFKFFPKSTSLFRLKCTASKLGLDNRRPSIEAWKERYKGRKSINDDFEKDDDLEINGEFSKGKIKSINSSLEWLKSELTEMKKQDQSLASQFLKIKKAIYKLKLEWSCLDHQCMIEDAETDIDALDELRRVTDLPLQSEIDLSLKEKGFTKFNVSNRRYSMA